MTSHLPAKLCFAVIGKKVLVDLRSHINFGDPFSSSTHALNGYLTLNFFQICTKNIQSIFKSNEKKEAESMEFLLPK